MHPPLDKSIVITPLANCWREGRLVCIENLNCDRNIENLTIHYKILSEAFPDKSACWLKKFPECELFPFEVREMVGTVLPYKCEAMAIVAPTASRQALRRSYSLARERGMNLQIFEHEADARKWLNQRC